MNPESGEGRGPNVQVERAASAGAIDLTDTDSVDVADEQPLPPPVSAFSLRMPTGLDGRYRAGLTYGWVATGVCLGSALVIGALGAFAVGVA